MRCLLLENGSIDFITDTTRIPCQLRRFFASKNELLRRYFDFCVEIMRRKSPEKIAKKVCDARIASKIRRKIYIASFIFDAIKKYEFIEIENDASKKRRKFKNASI